MSDVQNTTEEQPAAPVEATPVVEPTTEAKAEETAAPAVEETPAAEPAKSGEPVAEAEAPASKAAPAKKEFDGEGVLGYKAPGLLKLLFKKRHFWFGSEPVEHKNLTNYLRGEKPDIANHNAAWSSQTGKGLLYFSKQSSEKATPAGIINLADVTDVTEDGTVDFFFHMHGLKHVFQASTLPERDNWVAALKAKITEAKEMAEEMKNSEGYKEQLSSLSKPAATPATVAPASKEPETKKEEKAEAKEEKKEEKSRKSRSASRKRNSIFGGFGIGSKKDESAEPKEEKKAEAKDAAPAETSTTEPTAAPVDGPAVDAAAAAAPVDESAKTETKTETATPAPAEITKPAPTNKRNSIFGTLSSKFGPKKSVSEAKSSEAAPAVPAKDTTEPVSSEAPVIPAPETSEPLAAAVESPATAPTTQVTNGVAEPEATKPEVKPEAKTEPAQKRKSSIPWLGTSKEKAADADGEKKPSTFSKLRQTIKRSPKAAEKAPEKAAEKAPEKAAEKTEKAAEPTAETSAEPTAGAPATSTEATETAEPIISEPISVAPAAAPQVSATA